MKNTKKQLLRQQTNTKLNQLMLVGEVTPPRKGWLNTIRTALNMSLRQLANKLQISPQSVNEIETREANGTVTLRTLREVAEAMDLQLVYGFIPKDGSLDALIERKARALAEQIVMRTSNTMSLEDQKVSYGRLKKAIKERTESIKDEMPKALWD